MVAKPRNPFTYDKGKYTISIPDWFSAVKGQDEKELYFVDRDHARIIHIKVVPFKTFLSEFGHDLNTKCFLKEVESIIKNKFVDRTVFVNGNKITFSKELRVTSLTTKK